MRQGSPSASATHDVEDGVEDLARGVHPGSSRGSRGRTTRHRRGRFDMIFSCSVEYRVTLSGTLFGQSRKVDSQKSVYVFYMTWLCSIDVASYTYPSTAHDL